MIVKNVLKIESESNIKPRLANHDLTDPIYEVDNN